MPKSNGIVYTPHSYAYWSHFYASPTDLLISKVMGGGGSKNAAPASGAPKFDIVKAVSDNAKLYGQYNTIVSGNDEQFKGLKRQDLDPKVQNLYDQVASLRAKSGTGDDPGFIERVFDILSRPMFAVANAYKATITEDQKSKGGTDVNDWEYIPIVGPKFWQSLSQGQELWDGFAGYDKTSWAENLDQLHPEMNNIAKGVLGFALDVAMDPTSYIGIGAVRSVAGKTLGEAGKIAGEADKTAAAISKGFQGPEGFARSEQVREAITQSFKERGITDPNYLDQLEVMDFRNPKDIARFITANIDSPERAKDMAKVGLEYKARHKRIVSAFIESTVNVMQEWTRTKKLEELTQAALKDGLLVDPKMLQPDVLIETLAYPALKMPEAEAVAHIRLLRQERGRLESMRSTAKTNGHPVDALDKRINAINTELGHLLDETPIDLKNPAVRDAVTRMTESDPEYLALKEQRDNLWKQYKAYKSQADKTGKYGAKVESLKNQMDALDMKMSEVATNRILKVMNEINLPETSRLAKYRKTKDWRKVADEYIRIYSTERKAAKAAETTANVATDAGDIGGAVNALKAKEAFGAKTSKQTNKALENARRELQYRIHNGQLTVEEVGQYLHAAGVDAPDLMHDLTQLLPEDSKILHFGESYRPSVKKKMLSTDEHVQQIITNNNRVRIELDRAATEHAKEISKQTLATAIDLMERATTLEARRAFALRLGFLGNGPAVASLAVPELVSRLVEQAYKVNIVSAGIKAFNKALVSSAGLDKGLARIRAREAGRTNELIARNGARIQQTFQHIPPADRQLAWEQLLRNDVKTYTYPAVVEALHSELDLIAQKFAHNAFPGLREPLSLEEVNEWIPGRHKLNSSRKKQPYQLKGRYYDAEQVSDPVDWLLNKLSENNLRDMDPVELIWDLQIATEKALARKATVESIVQNFGISAGRWVNGKMFMDDPVAERLMNEYGYRAHKLGTEAFIFDPETAKQLDKIQELFSSPKMMETFGEYAGKITQAWKRIVTVYNPGFHSRNTFGDIFVSWLDGVEGVHGVQSHRMALRTIKKFRNLVDPEDPLIKALGQPNMMESYNNLKRTKGVPESHKVVLFRKNGQNFTIGDVWAAYVNEGLLSGYTNTEFAAVFKAPKTFGATKAGQQASRVNQSVLHLSEAREDVFRLAHFIDILRKSPIKDLEKASAEAGARVRKFHFDYSDFTMTEKLLFARVFPFYKWTRKAFPLMVESLFSTPGKMTMYPKAMNNLGVATGFGGNSPDIVVPEWIQSRMLAPILAGAGSTTYAGIALPYDALRAVGSPGDSVLGMLHPGLKAIIEGSMGQKFSGQDINAQQYLTGLFPQSNMVAKQMSGAGTPEQLASFLTGITFTQNNSKTIQSELIKQKEKANASIPKPTSG